MVPEVRVVATSAGKPRQQELVDGRVGRGPSALAAAPRDSLPGVRTPISGAIWSHMRVLFIALLAQQVEVSGSRSLRYKGGPGKKEGETEIGDALLLGRHGGRRPRVERVLGPPEGRRRLRGRSGVRRRLRQSRATQSKREVTTAHLELGPEVDAARAVQGGAAEDGALVARPREEGQGDTGWGGREVSGVPRELKARLAGSRTHGMGTLSGEEDRAAHASVPGEGDADPESGETART